MLLQLNPTIPITTPKGKGQALVLIDYGSEHNLMWVTAIDDTGEIWTFQNSEVCAQKNITMKRLCKEKNESGNLDIRKYKELDRIDILCGFPNNPEFEIIIDKQNAFL